MAILKVTIVTLALIVAVSGHGRLLKPPNRSSVWRFPEFSSQNPPPNYTDNELNCGGLHQDDKPGSNCGVCGDRLDAAVPRDNEHGGKYGQGIVTGRYTAGQVIDVEVELTQGHKGYFEWRLCTDRRDERSQECFNRHLLELEGGGTQLGPIDQRKGIVFGRVRLPAGVRCSECVLQWNYRTGNRFGECDDGTSGPGCGPQETFRGCSDIVIE